MNLLIERFPPSPRRLLDVARRDVDDSMLWDIARADYGFQDHAAFADLRSIRDTGVIPAPVSRNLFEVLELTRWCRPDKPNPPPFEPGPTGTRGHQIRLFACAAILRAASDPASHYSDMAIDSTMANCLESAGVLGDEFTKALGCWTTWRFHSSDFPVLDAITLLTLAIRLRSNSLDESELNSIALWVLEQEPVSRFRGHEPEPLPLSLQQGLWQPVAVELETEAKRIGDPDLRENIQLCSLILHPGWEVTP